MRVGFGCIGSRVALALCVLGLGCAPEAGGEQVAHLEQDGPVLVLTTAQRADGSWEELVEHRDGSAFLGKTLAVAIQYPGADGVLKVTHRVGPIISIDSRAGVVIERIDGEGEFAVPPGVYLTDEGGRVTRPTSMTVEVAIDYSTLLTSGSAPEGRGYDPDHDAVGPSPWETSHFPRPAGAHSWPSPLVGLSVKLDVSDAPELGYYVVVDADGFIGRKGSGRPDHPDGDLYSGQAPPGLFKEVAAAADPAWLAAGGKYITPGPDGPRCMFTMILALENGSGAQLDYIYPVGSEGLPQALADFAAHAMQSTENWYREQQAQVR